MRRLLRALARLSAALFALVPFTISTSLFCLLGVAAVLVFTEEGSRFALDQAEQLSGGRLQARAVRGTLSGPLYAQALVYQDRHVRVALSDLTLDLNLGALLAAQVVVTRLEARQLDLQLQRPPPSGRPPEPFTGLPLPLWVRDLRIQSFQLYPRPAAAPLSFSAIAVQARWIGERLTLHQARARLEPLGNLAAEGALLFKPEGLQLEAVRSSGFVQGRAELFIGYQDQVRGQLQWQSLHWPPEGERLFDSPGGQLELDGVWHKYRYRLQAQVLARGQQAQLRAKGEGSLQGLSLEPAQAQLLGGRVQAQGRVQWLPQVDLALQGEAQGLDPGRWQADWPGRLNGRYSLDLRGLQQGAQGELSARLQDSQLRGWPLQLELAAQLKPGALHLSRFELQTQASSLSLQGQVRPPYRFQARLDSPDLSALWPGLSGQARASLDAEGERLRLEASSSGLRYQNYAAGRSQLSADLHPREAGRLRLSLLRAELGLPFASLELSGEGRAAEHQLRIKAVSQAGLVELGLRGTLDLAQRRWQGQLRSGSGAPENLAPWLLSQPTALSLSAGQLDLDPACWRNAAAEACLEVHQRGAAWRMAFRLSQWNLAYLAGLLPAGLALDGELSGSGRMAGDGQGLQEVFADLRSGAGRVRYAGEDLLVFAPSQFLLEEKTSGLDARLHIPLQDGQLQLEALAAPGPVLSQRALAGRLQLDLQELGALSLLSAEIEQPRGRLRAGFALAGHLGAPRLDGEAALDEASLRLATPGTVLESLSAQLRADATQWQLQAEARSSGGSGRLQIEGQRGWAADAPLALAIRGQDFLAVDNGQAQIWVSPDLRFTLAQGLARLRGELGVPRADIHPRDFAQGQGPSSDQVIVQQGQREGSGFGLDSQVRLVLGEEVRFDGFGLKTRLTGSLNAYDQPGQPTRARGDIELRGGRYQAYGQDLTIETGRLLFDGGSITEPAIELRATRKPREDITVGLTARGPLDAPEFSLFSEPTMPQERQLSWLVLGRALEENPTGSSENKDREALSGAALSLGLSGGNLLAQRFTGDLRLDEISIASRPGESAEQAKLTFGKYLSPKLYVSYGIGLFQPGHTFRLQYDIGKGFKLATETGVESGGDLLYSIER